MLYWDSRCMFSIKSWHFVDSLLPSDCEWNCLSSLHDICYRKTFTWSCCLGIGQPFICTRERTYIIEITDDVREELPVTSSYFSSSVLLFCSIPFSYPLNLANIHGPFVHHKMINPGRLDPHIPLFLWSEIFLIFQEAMKS